MELKVYLRFLWRWLWLILILVAAGAAVGYLNANRQPRMYAATAKLLVNQDQGRFAVPSPTLEDLRARERFSQTVMEVIQTRTVLGEVLANLGLTEEIALGQLLSRVETQQVENTEIFTLEVTDPDRDRAKLIAEEIVRVFRANERELLDNPFAQGSSLIVVEEAYVSRTPVSPNPVRDAMLIAMIGLLAALVIGYLRDYFNDDIGGGGEMERRTGLSPLAEIGSINGASPAARLVARSAPYSADAETYRMFRGYIDGFPAGSPLQSLLVTSPGPRAGKTLSAVNLAVALAQTGKRVILVDADLRNPSAHEYFGLSNEIGLSSALVAENHNVAAYLRPTGVENLRVLTAGPASLQPTQALGSAAFTALATQLRSEADLLIFDTPSLLSVVDAALVMRSTDAVLLVARAAPTRLAALRRLLSDPLALLGRYGSPATSAAQLKLAFEQVQQADTSVLGVLLNDVAGGRRRDRSYYSDLQQRQTAGLSPASGRVEAASRAGGSRLANKTGD